MWVLIAVFLQGASGVSSQSIYFADQAHCVTALEEMQKAMPSIPSATYLFHCAEVGSTGTERAGERAPNFQKM